MDYITPLQDLYATLEGKIAYESCFIVTDFSEGYLTGLCDAQDIVRDYIEADLMVGRLYYVLVYDKQTGLPRIQRMKLYKASETVNQKTYCFTLDIKTGKSGGETDVYLSSRDSISKRVFKDSAKAQEELCKCL